MFNRRLLIVGLLSLLMTFVTARYTVPAKAAIVIPKKLIQSGSDFQKGKFGLTGLTEGQGIQLLSLGTLGRWQRLSNSMCEPTAYMGTATFREYIYSVGGLTRVSNLPVATTGTCRTKVLSVNGDISPWVNDKPLPQALSAVEAVAIQHPSNASLGILYAFGGKGQVVGAGGQVDTIYSANINPDGSLQAWQTLSLALPTKLEKHTVTAYTHPRTGKTYIYVIGGYERPSGTLLDIPYPDVWRTEVQSNGSLSAWVNGAASGVPPLPIPNSVYGASPVSNECLPFVGLYDADAINMDAISLTQEKRMIAVIGGIFQTQSDQASCPTGPAPSSLTFLGEIADNGNITWQTGTDYNVLKPVSQIRAVGINQKIYAVGGYVHTDIDKETSNLVYSSYIDNNFQLGSFGESNYLENPNALSVDDRRAAHGLEVVVYQNRPLAYLFGGTTTTNFFRDDVLYSLIGRDEDISSVNASYPATGLYLSPPYTLRGPGMLTEMSWTAQISATGTINTDIAIDYRLANSIDEIKSAPWIGLDADLNSTKRSVNGLNVVSNSDPTIGKVIQFRAVLSTNTPQDRSATPVLRAPIDIKYSVDGHPSMYIVSAAFPTITSGSANEPTMVIRNDKPPTSTRTETVLDADIADPEGQSGTFFIDMYVFPPGAPVTIPVSSTNGAYPLTSVAFAEIPKAGFPAGSQASVDAPLWKRTCGNSTNCPPVKWSVIFNKKGVWNVIAIIDSSNNIPEADEINGEWEGDNIYQFTVTSDVLGGDRFLPIILSKGP